ncbi:maleylpyruvate isomerase family mycothiol-dependent enzyme [Pseudonocardia saturnea]
MGEDVVWRVIDAERSRLVDLLEDLGDADWRTRSLCTGWTVREVAAHLTLANTGPLSLAVSLIRAGAASTGRSGTRRSGRPACPCPSIRDGCA